MVWGVTPLVITKPKMLAEAQKLLINAENLKQGVWKQVLSGKEFWFDKYEGWISSGSGPMAYPEELKKLGWKIISGGTDSHLILVDTWMNGAGISGEEASNKLEKKGIIVNKNTIPNETRSPMDPSGIRLGTAGETTRGAKEKDMIKLANRIDKVLRK